jgi:hypothetical protein
MKTSTKERREYLFRPESHAVVSWFTPINLLPAPDRDGPSETLLLPLLRCQAGVVLPMRGDASDEVVHLGAQPDAAVGVHGADLLRAPK